MTLVTVSTVKGAPGGTTVALLLARRFAESRRRQGGTPVLAECDLSGGDLAPALGLLGVPGMASLAVAARHGLTEELLTGHAQVSSSLPDLRLLLGIAGPEQGAALSWMWRDLARLLSSPSLVAVADLGRCGIDDRQGELCRAAGANLLVTTDGVAALLHARAAVESAERDGCPLALVVTGVRRRRLSQIAEVTGAEVLGAIRYDPRAVSGVLQLGGSPRRAGMSRGPQSSEGALGDVAAIASRLAGRLPDLGAAMTLDPRAERVSSSLASTRLAVTNGAVGRLRRRLPLLG